jgi:hypothetical protein
VHGGNLLYGAEPLAEVGPDLRYQHVEGDEEENKGALDHRALNQDISRPEIQSTMCGGRAETIASTTKYI